MRCSLFIPFSILVLITLLAAGCSQSGADLEKPYPATTGTESSPGGISPQVTASPAAPAASPALTTSDMMKRGTADPDFVVDISVPGNIAPGTTILADNHDAARPRIIEVNRLGEVLWEYPLPDDLKTYTNPGWDVEVVQNGNILTVLPRNGVYEISRNKQVVWKYLDPKVSHDADRLPDGNTLIAFGAGDRPGDAQVKEVDREGHIVWSWHAGDIFARTGYVSISDEGWTHTNAVSRLDNGNTLISLRNFNLVAEVDQNGKLVRTIGKGILEGQHDPLVLPDGNLLMANHGEPQAAIELDPSGNVVWQFTVQKRQSWPVRDANRLENGNTLITESDRIVEVTKDGRVVWQFRLATYQFGNRTDIENSSQSRGFYKAERIP